MALALLLFFNGFILFYVSAIGVELFKKHYTNFDLFLCALISFLVVCSLAFLFHSPLGQWFLRFTSGARQAIDRERKKLDPIIEQVQSAVQTKHGLKPLNLHIMVIDDPAPNAMAIGQNTLVVTRAFYETSTDEEIAGVVAHELGHLHYGDSNKLGIALGVSTVSLSIAGIAGLFLMLVGTIQRIVGEVKGDFSTFITLFSFVFVVMGWFFLVFVKLGNWMLKLAMFFVGRKQEYRADQFAVRAGFGAGLLSFLEKVKNFEWTSNPTFMTKLTETHPPVMLRIGEIEKAFN